MSSDIDIFLKLKHLKASLLKDIQMLDIAIEAAKPKDLLLLDKLANEEMVGVFEYRLCVTNIDKIKFALDKLGKANIDDIAKYLTILGENIYSTQLKSLVRSTIKILKGDQQVIEEQTENGLIYYLNKKPARQA